LYTVTPNSYPQETVYLGATPARVIESESHSVNAARVIVSCGYRRRGVDALTWAAGPPSIRARPLDFRRWAGVGRRRPLGVGGAAGPSIRARPLGGRRRPLVSRSIGGAAGLPPLGDDPGRGATIRARPLDFRRGATIRAGGVGRLSPGQSAGPLGVNPQAALIQYIPALFRLEPGAL
jgi:hypothetical protein